MTLPMFPLGTVLLPSMLLPLHVFEPRYRALVHDCLAADRSFGVVLIERGSEVGGGDQRCDVGTIAQIVEAVELPDGRWALGAVGVRRLRVTAWLEDDPYPRAEVEEWDDPAPGSEDELRAMVTATTGLLRRVLARKAELGDAAAPATQEISDDLLLATYQLVAVSPLGPADQQSLLEAPTPEQRVDALARLLSEEDDVLTRRFELAAREDDDRP